MLIELKDFEGWDFKGLWADLKFDVSHQEQMDRIAILGDKRWQDWGICGYILFEKRTEGDLMDRKSIRSWWRILRGRTCQLGK